MKTLKKILKITGVVLLLTLIAAASIAMYNWRDRNPGYALDLKIENKSMNPIRAGFAKRPITPTIIDTWNDANGNHKYNKKEGDTYNDNNNNGKFDAYWIAGMSNAKPAQGVHDDVWSRVMVIEDNSSRIAMISLDAIGFLHGDVVAIRNRIPKELGIDYTLISSTHTHESNDLIGIWGENMFNTGVNPEMMEYVKTQTVAAITEAVGNMRSAKLVFAEDLSGADGAFIKDTREPIVKATGIHLMQVLDAENETTMGTLINWSNHPETLWSQNLLISSDFPHFIREAVESGVYHNDQLMEKGLGGMAIYFTGAIGGLMAPHPSLPIPDPFTGEEYLEPTFKKTKALGDQIALLSLAALKQKGDTIPESNISLSAKTLSAPVENNTFKLTSAIGLIQMGMPEYFKLRTEVGAIRIGPSLWLSIPGEIYPEIVFGGIEAPEGSDFNIDPIEVPPIAEFIKDQYKFYLGLSNDEIGYIIPKSQWDVEKPYLYNRERATYGESNSLGPETGPLIYKALIEVIQDLD
ncbi:hypothetical protein [Arenibacter certesii]|uniref:Neutral/alkaline non-lysosomal ceramidase N-terminal domain-containing protein n=1 Tax=Arenibacter certesii TaxID=228955 RepID=A0A918IMW1_9FLAO|nr:hypothetical protein [Arenibacter certesii]GGW23480.1 hypothetical protein GCM10007383_04610 [Arenibacter certesii]